MSKRTEEQSKNRRETKKKKFFMIIILIVFIVAIGLVLANVNKKSVERINEQNNEINSTNSSSAYGEVNADNMYAEYSGTARKVGERAEADLNDMLTVTDSFFIEQTNDFYYNMEDYIGKTVKLEGLIYAYDDELKGDICYAVVRNTPGCCGNDGLVGLDIRDCEDYPEEGAWVEVVGVVEVDRVYGEDIPVLRVASMVEKEEGKSFVTN